MTVHPCQYLLMLLSPHIFQRIVFVQINQAARVLNRSVTPCPELEVFEVSSSRRCRAHGPTVFAPVVR